MKKSIEMNARRCFAYVLLNFLACVVGATAMAQTAPNPRILVLSTHEGDFAGYASAIADDQGGMRGIQGAAKAFGYVPDSATDVSPASVPASIQPTPAVTFRYGILSMRKRITAAQAAQPEKAATSTTPYVPAMPSAPKDDVAVGDSNPTSPLVRVVSSTLENPDTSVTVSEHVQSVADNTDTLDLDPTNANDLATLQALFAPNGQRYDLIVVTSAYRKITDAAYRTLTYVMQSPSLKPNSILFFVDSCCDTRYYYSNNTVRLVKSTLQPGSGANNLTIGASYDNFVTTPLNTASVDFSRSFGPNPPTLPSGYPTAPVGGWLPTIDGGWVSPITVNGGAMPTSNVLYMLSAADSRAYGLFYPTAQSFNNTGTCTFAVLDITEFGIEGDLYTSNTRVYLDTNNVKRGKNLGQAFVNASLAGGSCGGNASIAAAPATQNTTLAPAATPTIITLTVKNESTNSQSNGDGSITGGRVVAALPPNLTWVNPATSVTTTCTDGTNSITPVVTTAGAGAPDSFNVSGIKVPYQGTCTIQLQVKWMDTGNLDPAKGATNACIDASRSTATLSIAPGGNQQFSTDQGQINDTVTANVVCSAPELALSVTAAPNAKYIAGNLVTYAVTVTNLSQTATATGAALSNLAPSGVTPNSVADSSNPASCNDASSCTLAEGQSATFTVTFTAPASGASMSWSPTVALATAGQEVTLDNNTAQLSANLESTVTVKAQLNGTGIGALAGANMAYSVSGCAATPANGNAPLGVNASGAAQSSTMPSGSQCIVAFAGTPDASQLPVGTVLTGPVITTSSPDVTTGNQTSLAVWTATAPGSLPISGSIQGSPSPFPSALVGKTVNYSLTCTGGTPIPANGQLTIAANGLLSAPSTLIPSGTNCSSMIIDGIAQLPAAPQNYEWKSSTATGSSAAGFVATLVMAPMEKTVTIGGSVVGAPTPFPTDLVGKTVSINMNCAPGAANPDVVTLTIDASGKLSAAMQPKVSSTSTCTPAFANIKDAFPTAAAVALPLPDGYEWRSAIITPESGNDTFIITLTMAKKAVTGANTAPVPTLSEWALYALVALMLLMAAHQLRTLSNVRNGKR